MIEENLTQKEKEFVLESLDECKESIKNISQLIDKLYKDVSENSVFKVEISTQEQYDEYTSCFSNIRNLYRYLRKTIEQAFDEEALNFIYTKDGDNLSQCKLKRLLIDKACFDICHGINKETEIFNENLKTIFEDIEEVEEIKDEGDFEHKKDVQLVFYVQPVLNKDEKLDSIANVYKTMVISKDLLPIIKTITLDKILTTNKSVLYKELKKEILETWKIDLGSIYAKDYDALKKIYERNGSYAISVLRLMHLDENINEDLYKGITEILEHLKDLEEFVVKNLRKQ